MYKLIKTILFPYRLTFRLYEKVPKANNLLSTLLTVSTYQTVKLPVTKSMVGRKKLGVKGTFVNDWSFGKIEKSIVHEETVVSIAPLGTESTDRNPECGKRHKLDDTEKNVSSDLQCDQSQLKQCSDPASDVQIEQP